MNEVKYTMADSQNLGAREPHRLIAADKVEGTKVRNPAGDDLGTIDNLMIDKLSGRVAYAVMSFGGFLGIGERYHTLPWAVLNYEPDEDAYVVDLDKETLENGPHYGAGDEIDWESRDWGKQVHEYYQVTPYWF